MLRLGIFSFFTGAGFLDLGFESAGFESLFANELMPDFCRVYKHSRKKLNRPLPVYGLRELDVARYFDDFLEQNHLSKSLKDAKEKHDLVGFVGGPPCPDFSVAGKNKGATGKHGKLSQDYLNLICRELPDFFVFENVKGLWRTSRHRAFFDSLVEQAQKAGYLTTTRLINSLEYGAPQDRDRIILIGIHKKNLSLDSCLTELPEFPWEKFIRYSVKDVKGVAWPKISPFTENSVLEEPRGIIPELTVEYWFRQNEVENHPNSNDYFVPRAGLIKMQTYSEGDDSKKCYKRLHRWRYSPTAAYGNNEVHLHPYKARRLSVAEALAIQSLPKLFELPADISMSSKFKTIGNGVPYLAAYGIARTLRDYLERNVR